MARNNCFAKTYIWQVIVMLAIGTQAVRAGDYSFEIPQLVGNYLGDITAIPALNVAVDLGIEFAEIESASLQLSGTQMLGRVGDLNSPYTWSLPAEIIAWSDRPGLYSDVLIDTLLPPQDGAFVFDQEFRDLHPADGEPDYSPWLSGVAEFDFTVAPPPMLAIYYLIEMPSVAITSATLVIQGQPNLDSFMLPGDFNGDGEVDGRDYLIWQRDPSRGDLGDWQTNYGTGLLAAASTAVPEPTCAPLLLIAALVLATVRRNDP